MSHTTSSLTFISLQICFPHRPPHSLLPTPMLKYRKSPLKEDNLSTKDKMAGPKGVLITTVADFPENCSEIKEIELI